MGRWVGFFFGAESTGTEAVAVLQLHDLFAAATQWGLGVLASPVALFIAAAASHWSLSDPGGTLPPCTSTSVPGLFHLPPSPPRNREQHALSLFDSDASARFLFLPDLPCPQFFDPLSFNHLSSFISCLYCVYLSCDFTFSNYRSFFLRTVVAVLHTYNLVHILHPNRLKSS